MSVLWIFTCPVWCREIIVIPRQHTALSVDIKHQVCDKLRLVYLQVFFLNRRAFGAYVSDTEFVSAVRFVRQSLE